MRSYSLGTLPCIGLLAVVALTAWLYWPGVVSPALLDDAVNLSVLEQLDESPEFFSDVILGNRSGLFGRSISMLTFGLEKLFIDEGLSGLKRTNVLIHLLIGTLMALLTTGFARRLSIPSPAWVGVAAAACWLLAPLLLSTVLYTVQRMAQLSTLFIVLGLLSYQAYRLRLIAGKMAWPFGVGVIPLGALAAFSKENGILLIPLIVLIELWMFQFDAASKRVSNGLKWSCYFIVAGSLVGALAVLVLQPHQIMGGYAIRNFNLLERLLTQPVILWHYVGQLFVPDVQQMGVFHDDVVVSRSLLDPVATLPAMLSWIVLVAASLLLRRSPEFRGVGFGLLFFCVAHTLESTVLPLELYFEHRNYLPSIGIFFAVTAGAATLIKSLPLMRGMMLAVLVAFLFQSVYGLTYMSALWSNRFLLHFAAVNSHPNSVRAAVELSRVYAEEGHITQALEHSDRVRQMVTNTKLRHDLRDILLHCMARSEVGNRVRNLEGDRAELLDTQTNETLTRLSELLREGSCPTVDASVFADQIYHIVQLPGPGRGTRRIYSEMASLENHLGRLDKALEYTESLLGKSPMDRKGLLMKLYFASELEVPEARAQALEQLLELRARGELNEREKFNLELFL